MNLLSLFFDNINCNFRNENIVKIDSTKRYISAMSIQSIYRMYIEKKNMDKKLKSIILIQKCWKDYLRRKQQKSKSTIIGRGWRGKSRIRTCR